jgi:hypothetical protein
MYIQWGWKWDQFVQRMKFFNNQFVQSLKIINKDMKDICTLWKNIWRYEKNAKGMNFFLSYEFFFWRYENPIFGYKKFTDVKRFSRLWKKFQSCEMGLRGMKKSFLGRGMKKRWLLQIFEIMLLGVVFIT